MAEDVQLDNTNVPREKEDQHAVKGSKDEDEESDGLVDGEVGSELGACRDWDWVNWADVDLPVQSVYEIEEGEFEMLDLPMLIDEEVEDSAQLAAEDERMKLSRDEEDNQEDNSSLFVEDEGH
ncbi:hypothetical protein M422DRAFT_267653 [Sphaerobolus stellatus SS14]|uniref:Uncharacterized protein n=1 Tax=Sphaerobolus stellatus (strain SS14) TaxID=990650 RepID=A0A0C9TLF3_SPHS4|nr:hypothetical protein M422DRAFT_267653 [Sphaerobolus stellatus SS14]